ncbi:alpha-ketoglutarate-dependent taurine dioxygenase [Edaphobacter lichenicola]|uniref:Alpha-ketoglutarate-dependent taurine dioxygenase n=2 Tax=Tunturiibacter TaxID=3154218 RepID=A0A852VBA4_9BACT|nr:alpha-ketoglutarate-dependent taurine dioxygenase [Edaphobacter lichenicola]
MSLEPSAISVKNFIHEAADRELDERGLTAFTNPSASALGNFFAGLDQRWTGNPFERGFEELIPIGRAAARPGSLSSFTGAAAQPMHTDAAYLASPPRYLVFECVDPGEVSCKTEAWVTNQAKLLEERPHLLTNPRWVFLGGGRSRFYSPVLDTVLGIARIRYDPYCMSAAGENKTTLNDVSGLLASYTRQVSFEWTQGAFLIIDNWRCMHARGVGGESAPSRRLRRWYLGAKNGLGI